MINIANINNSNNQNSNNNNNNNNNNNGNKNTFEIEIENKNTNMVGGKRRKRYIFRNIAKNAKLLGDVIELKSNSSCLVSFWCQFFKPQKLEKTYDENIILQRFLWFGLADAFDLSGEELLDVLNLSRQHCNNLKSCSWF